MSLADILLIGVLLAGALAAGTAAWCNRRIIRILKARHPAAWAGLRASPFPKRTAFGNFLMGDQPRRLGDPELSRAVRQSKIAGMTFIACLVAGSIAVLGVGAWRHWT